MRMSGSPCPRTSPPAPPRAAPEPGSSPGALLRNNNTHTLNIASCVICCYLR